MNERKTLNKTEASKRKKIISLISIITFIAVIIAIFIVAGKPITEFVSNPSKFRAWIDSHRFLSRIAFIGMMSLQIIVAFILGEPLEIAAGYAFGFFEGTILCEIGILIGSAIVFLFVRLIGIKAVEVFFPREKIQSIKLLQNTKKLNMLVFIIFFIPRTPKDIVTYFIGLTPMKLSTWLLITVTARIPSVITSTIDGNALGLQNYTAAIWVFAGTAVLSILGMIIYRIISCKETTKEN